MACGTPVISCPRGALPEIVEEGRDGFLIRNEAEGVAAAKRIGTINRRACRRKVEEKFSLSVITDQYVRIYKNLA